MLDGIAKNLRLDYTLAQWRAAQAILILHNGNAPSAALAVRKEPSFTAAEADHLVYLIGALAREADDAYDG